MGKRQTLLLGAATGLILIAVLAHKANPPEPSYKGKLLSSWIQQLDQSVPLATQESVRDALHHMGTNATLLLADWACYDRRLRRHLLQRLPRRLQKFSVLHTDIIDDPHGYRGAYAGQALILLGPEASPTFPKLGRALTDEEFFGVATRALWILREIGEPAVPTLAYAMTNKPSRMRDVIAMNLGHMGRDAMAAVPALKSLLASPDPFLRNECMQSIEAIEGKHFTNAPPP